MYSVYYYTYVNSCYGVLVEVTMDDTAWDQPGGSEIMAVSSWAMVVEQYRITKGKSGEFRPVSIAEFRLASGGSRE